MKQPTDIEVSVVIPCLNEELTLQGCIDAAQRGIAEAGINGEIIVSDNGSTDKSIAIAEAAGARVVHCQAKGYGNALKAGFAAAKGHWLIMGDADQSYDFSQLPRFKEQIDKGYDLVMGTRLKGTIEPGAMPGLHRWFGNPFLTAVLKLLFRAPISDTNCGLRAFRQDALEKMDLRTTGMEMASEMVIKSAKHGLKITEIPITLHRDARDRPPHMRSFRDGWRNLRFMLMLAPDWLFILPGLLLMLLGGSLLAWLYPQARTIPGGITLDVHTMYFGMVFTIIGFFIVLIGIFAKLFCYTEHLGGSGKLVPKLANRFTLEHGLLASLGVIIIGLAGIIWVIAGWASEGFGELDVQRTIRPVILFGTIFSLGVQSVFAAFFLSMLGISRDTYIGRYTLRRDE